MKKTNFIIVFIGFTILLISCKNEISKSIPLKHTELSQGKYDKYLNKLNEAYASNDNFEVAIQLANLKAKASTTFELLNQSITENHNNCEKIYDWYYLYDRHNFRVNILKLDTTKFKDVVLLCNNLEDQRTYEQYALMKDEEERHAKESKEIEDTTNFNMKLVAELNQIHYDDQNIRKRKASKNITAELKEILRREMHLVDSINLNKIDKIFNQHGYPSKKLVGRDGNFTPALVIHHSKDLETRYKYLPLLEKAVNDGLLYEGTLDMIKRRIEDMELNKKQ